VLDAEPTRIFEFLQLTGMSDEGGSVQRFSFLEQIRCFHIDHILNQTRIRISMVK
jgi:hypothetical protein